MKSKIYSGIVWIVAGIALATYAFLALTGYNLPGVENLVAFINSSTGNILYLAVFIAIFFEGMYVIGSVIPGTSFVLISTILAQTGGPFKFLSIIFTIYIGWLLAGVFNVVFAKFLTSHLKVKESESKIEENAEVTWFPAFRANTEVSHITEGHKPGEVLWSSFKIKSYACLALIPYALIIPFFVDFGSMENEEGFRGLFAIALINIGVGVYKIYKSPKADQLPSS
tara:strand:+ start:870 stop:1547 length:678 start_codon:yes stop_codon:yes gene_type:complete